MSDIIRAMAFIFGCIGTRLALAAVARAYGDNTRRDSTAVRYGLALTSTIIAVGLFYHYAFGTRPVAFEAGGAVWWNRLRPVHAALHLLFAIAIVAPSSFARRAWLILVVDAMLGLAAWVAHRSTGVVFGHAAGRV